MPLDVPSIFNVAPKIQTPLMLAALVVLVLFFLLQKHLDKEQTKMLFVLTFVSIGLAVSSYLFVVWIDRRPIQLTRGTIDGRVYSPPNDLRVGVSKASVYLKVPGEPLRVVYTDDQGYYSLNVSMGVAMREFQMWVAAGGYQASEVQSFTMTESSHSINFGLSGNPVSGTPLEPKKQPHTVSRKELDITPKKSAMLEQSQLAATLAPVCPNGTWRERFAGVPDGGDTFQWNLSTVGDKLEAVRTDGFVAGSFVRFGTNWKGELRWGGKTVWHDVMLIPSDECRQIGTNRGWTYYR